MTTNGEVAGALFAAIEAGDIEAVQALYAPDAVVWHNSDGLEQSREENLRVLRWLVRRTTERSYRERRLFDTGGGFVQQHVLRLTLPGGEALDVPACIVAEVRDGQIRRIDEYLDPAQVAGLGR